MHEVPLSSVSMGELMAAMRDLVVGLRELALRRSNASASVRFERKPRLRAGRPCTRLGTTGPGSLLCTAWLQAERQKLERRAGVSDSPTQSRSAKTSKELGKDQANPPSCTPSRLH